MFAAFIPGLPKRMGAALCAVFQRDGYDQHAHKLRVIGEIQADRESLPLTADEDALFNAADRASRECYQHMTRCITLDAGLLAVGILCKKWGVPLPTGEDEHAIVARAVDRGWWLRQLRKLHARRFEHAAIQLGLTGIGIDPYISRESAIRQARRNRANQKLLEKTEVKNEFGQVFSLAALADKGVGNKANRRGELMTRIRGFEEVAGMLNHAAMFWTVTCPSKFHAVGGTNPKYNGATPREAQAYLVKTWALIRAQLHREDIRPYGFRIAEPHTDGCPHWHMLFFVERKHVARMAEIIKSHALSEDGDEAGAQENRVKLVHIEAGKGGSAAGYIAKYISKNIDGYGVGDHKAFENGETYRIDTDMFGQWELTPSQRVTYWSQVWGIRQFQQIGGAPVGIWRELRRIKPEDIQGAPEALQTAWHAVQSVKEMQDGAQVTVKQADFAAFMQALGGPRTGRNTLIRLAKDEVKIEGKYATYTAKKPIGVYAIEEAEVIYKSVRYTWERLGEKKAAPVAFAVPRTGVNKCTEAALKKSILDQYGPAKNQKICSAVWNFVVGWDVSRLYDKLGHLLTEAVQKKRRGEGNEPFDAEKHLKRLRKKHDEH